ncbi:integrin-linked protein kinase 1 [Selaginella moellendorffii]|uniref:integrin-linked protein kinase 1 n=1 Tax=Selaginella moellendorffii TaxID=88036 RepID=UPI000D1CF5EF|nr:integrin-linked protein kinase 1 [Selaginella moellendorffii]XP_024542765.1 integrin-linked protein kinase 1 [Selaginella moellendorffii]|eukprot:XP_024542764.1 integrin-linked protein kinase 1 [Selaginella moellendorffii]
MAVIRYLGRQSSMAPEGSGESRTADNSGDMESGAGDDDASRDVIQLLWSASLGDVAGVRALLGKGMDVNSTDFDSRTALHVAACEGKKETVELLIAEGADVNARDRWGSTPLADAEHYKCDEVSQILLAHGAQLPDTSPMRVSNSYSVPEYEIDREELSVSSEDSFTIGKWRGTKVFVKVISIDTKTGDDKLKEFINELSLALMLRHPNVVQFLGAVTQSIPVMLVMEHLPKGDLQSYMKKKGKPLKPKKALKFALDIARGLNYVHEFKPEPVIHSNLKPSNLLRDKAGHLKITDFAFTKYAFNDRQFVPDSGRYMAPELYRCEDYDSKVDVFSFALIVQEMMEGVPPFPKLGEEEVAKSYADGKRPPFKIKPRYYPEGLKDLIEECWHDDPRKRPSFRTICKEVEKIRIEYNSDTFKACVTKVRYSRFCCR